MENKIITAGLIIIGDEILSGRTTDQNINFLAKNLAERGINLREVRLVGDVEVEIIFAVNEMRKKFNYIFTSGGIGPTHDDITALAVAKAFDDKLIKNLEAEKILFNHYGRENVNEARLKMAFVPSKAMLLDNPVSSAPGFRIENVFVMAGVPKIFQAMFEAAKKELISGAITKSREIKVNLLEGMIAKDLTDLQTQYPQVLMGSYPFENGTALVFRSTDYEILDKSLEDMVKVLHKIEGNLTIEIS